MSQSAFKSLSNVYNFSKKPTSPPEISRLLKLIAVPIDMWGVFLIAGSIANSSLITASYDGLQYVLLGYAIHFSQSRMAACFVILFALSDLVASVSHISTNIFWYSAYSMAYLVFSLSGIRALQLTSAYHRLVQSRFNLKNTFLKIIIALCYSLVITSGLLFVIYSFFPTIDAQLQANERTIGVFIIVIFAIALFGLLPGTKNRSFCVPTPK